MARANAKEPLIDAAMELFSAKGYDGTGVDEIAESIGIKGPTIYKYYKNKEDLLKAVIKRAEAEYDEGMGLTLALADKICSGEELRQYAMKSLHFTIENDTAKKMRKLITMEQYRNEMLSKLTTKHQLTYLQDFYASLFQKMMDAGKMVKGDADIIALEFIAPITLMVQMVDREPDKKEEAFKTMDKHMDLFLKRYEVV